MVVSLLFLESSDWNWPKVTFLARSEVTRY